MNKLFIFLTIFLFDLSTSKPIDQTDTNPMYQGRLYEGDIKGILNVNLKNLLNETFIFKYSINNQNYFQA
jgi:hypothetical protein